MLNDTAQFAAKSVGHTKTSPLVSIKQLQDILARDEIDPAALKRFHRCPISLAGQRCVYSQQLTRLRYP